MTRLHKSVWNTYTGSTHAGQTVSGLTLEYFFCMGFYVYYAWFYGHQANSIISIFNTEQEQYIIHQIYRLYWIHMFLKNMTSYNYHSVAIVVTKRVWFLEIVTSKSGTSMRWVLVHHFFLNVIFETLWATIWWHHIFRSVKPVFIRKEFVISYRECQRWCHFKWTIPHRL